MDHHLTRDREERIAFCKQILKRELTRGLEWNEAMKTVERNLMHRFSLGYHARKDYLTVLEDLRDEITDDTEQEKAESQGRIKAEADNVSGTSGSQK